jgi:hypothetical protein
MSLNTTVSIQQQQQQPPVEIIQVFHHHHHYHPNDDNNNINNNNTTIIPPDRIDNTTTATCTPDPTTKNYNDIQFTKYDIIEFESSIYHYFLWRTNQISTTTTTYIDLPSTTKPSIETTKTIYTSNIHNKKNKNKNNKESKSKGPSVINKKPKMRQIDIDDVHIGKYERICKLLYDEIDYLKTNEEHPMYYIEPYSYNNNNNNKSKNPNATKCTNSENNNNNNNNSNDDTTNGNNIIIFPKALYRWLQFNKKPVDMLQELQQQQQQQKEEETRKQCLNNNNKNYNNNNTIKTKKKKKFNKKKRTKYDSIKVTNNTNDNKNKENNNDFDNNDDIDNNNNNSNNSDNDNENESKENRILRKRRRDSLLSLSSSSSTSSTVTITKPNTNVKKKRFYDDADDLVETNYNYYNNNIYNSNNPFELEKEVTLSSHPRTLYELWKEYEYGIDGRKPAKAFSKNERGGKNKFKYCRRRIFWDIIVLHVRAGYTAEMAIEKVYNLYGPNLSVTYILQALQKDKLKYDGTHPNLRI